LGIVFMAQNAATDTEHHRAMAIDKRSECVLISIFEKAGKELTIRRCHFRGLPGQTAGVLHNSP
jgi:hypothetical protein